MHGEGSGRSPRYIRQPGYAVLNVHDLKASRDFYVRGCNLTPVWEEPASVGLRCSFEHQCLVLRQADEASLGCMAYETLDDTATAALLATVRALGRPVREAPPTPGRLGTTFQFMDLEGNWVEVYRAQERLPGALASGPFTLRRLGHFALRTQHLDAAVEFYRSIGFRVSDRSARGAFLRSHTDHHSLALLPSPASSLHHHAYDVGAWDQMKNILDWMYRQDVVPELGPVRHGPGNNISIYVRDPDGFRIEFYCEMESIEDDEDHQRVYLPKVNLWLRQDAPASFFQ